MLPALCVLSHALAPAHTGDATIVRRASFSGGQTRSPEVVDSNGDAAGPIVRDARDGVSADDWIIAENDDPAWVEDEPARVSALELGPHQPRFNATAVPARPRGRCRLRRCAAPRA